MNLWILHLLEGFANGPTADAVIIFLAEYLPFLLVLGALACLWLMPRPKRQRATAIALSLIAPALSRGIAEVIRLFYHHPRPFSVLHTVPLFPETSWSFPSGHASWFFALSMVVFSYDKRIGIAFFALSVVMSAARVAAGVHWPLDIVGGAILGILVAAAARHYIEKARMR